MLSAIIAISACATSVFADDFDFDMTKARPTYGGGQAYTSYTRLDNERRDKDNFNPLWMTENTVIEVQYVTSDEYEETPIYLILQSWTGDLVDGTEDKWIPISPTACDNTSAVWDYATIIAAYGEDLSDVYSIVLSDEGENALTVTSMIVRDLDIPDDDKYTVANGVVLIDGKPITAPEAETEVVTEIVEDDITSETVQENETVKNESDENAETKATVNDEQPSETESSSSTYTIVLSIIAALLAVVLVVMIIRNKIKAKWGGWR